MPKIIIATQIERLDKQLEVSEELINAGYEPVLPGYGDLLETAITGIDDSQKKSLTPPLAVISRTLTSSREALLDIIYQLRAEGYRVLLLPGPKGSEETEYITKNSFQFGVYDFVYDPLSVDKVVHRILNPATLAEAGVDPDYETEGPQEDPESDTEPSKPSTERKKERKYLGMANILRKIKNHGENDKTELPTFPEHKPLKYIAVASPWVPGGASTLTSLLASELAGIETVAAIDCDLTGRSLGIRFGVPSTDLWEWDWQETENAVMLKSGITLFLLDPFKEQPLISKEQSSEQLDNIIKRTGENSDRVFMDTGTEPGAWWFEQASKKAGVVVWAFREDPVLLARAKSRWQYRPNMYKEICVLYGPGDPAEIEFMFGIPCMHVEDANDKEALRQLISSLDLMSGTSGGLHVLVVGYNHEDISSDLDCHSDSLPTTYEARHWLDRNTPSAILLSKDLPDITHFIRDIKSDPKLGSIPVGVVNGTPEMLAAGADDIMFELSPEALELLIVKASCIKDVKETAYKDGLTGLPVRRAGEQALKAMFKEFKKNGEPISVALLDLDHFKKVNDDHGHAAGDKVLSMFGDFIMKNLRSTDIPCRWGGEEFFLAFRNTKVDGAVQACENLLSQWRTVDISLPNGGALQTTFSTGVAALSTNISEAINAADQALYRAKAEGRARVKQA